MRTLLAAAFLGLAAAVPGSAYAQDRVVHSYDARCHYRCCNDNGSCTVNSFYMSTKGDPKRCTWAAVCQKGGQGWSYGGTPTENKSTLRVENGCWHLVQDRKTGKYSTKPCSAVPTQTANPPAPSH
jgi:hypothetical protein